MKSQKTLYEELLQANSMGNDQNLAEHGDERKYWYSMADFHGLLQRFMNPQPDQKYLLVLPCEASCFEGYLSSDINKILSEGEYSNTGSDLTDPKLIIIPLLSSIHWQLITITINYETDKIQINFFDPYGEGGFPQAKQDGYKAIIKEQIQRILRRSKNDNEFILQDDSIKVDESKVDKQGKGSNGWDCGPIVYAEIETTICPDLSENDPSRVTKHDSPGHEKSMVDLRKKHRARLQKSTSKEESKKFAKDKQEEVKNKLGIDSLDGLNLDIFSPTQVQVLFAMIESKREAKKGQLDKKEYLEIYEEVKQIREQAQSDKHLESLETDKMAGLKCTLHGNLYQLAILTLAAIRARKKSNEFFLVSESEKHEKFDDLVLDCKNKLIFLQAKHASKEGDNYSKTNLKAGHSAKEKAGLAIYFDSWYKLSHSDFAKDKETKYIFFSNRAVNEGEKFLEEFENKEDEFLFEGLVTKNYRFKKDESVRQEFIQGIKEHSEIISKQKEGEQVTNLAPAKQPNKRAKKASVANLISSVDADNYINQFLDEYILKLEQPNNSKLEEIIAKELKISIEIGAKEFENLMFNKMMHWLAEPLKYTLTYSEFDRTFTQGEADIKRFYLLESTHIFIKQCQVHGKVINTESIPDIIGLDEFIQGAKGSIATIIEKGGAVEQQIFKSINKVKNISKDEWSFLKLNNEFVDFIAEILHGVSSKFYIIDCRLCDIDQSREKIINIIESAEENKKKILFIINEQLKESLDKIIQDKSFECKTLESKPLDHDKIIEISQKFLENYVSIAKKQLTIKEIIESKNGGIYELMHDARYLEQILNTAEDKNKQNVKSEIPYEYVENKVTKGIPYYDISIIQRTQKNVKFYICEIDDEDHEEFLTKLDELLIEEKQDDKWGKIYLLKKNAEDNDQNKKFIFVKNKKMLEHVGNMVPIIAVNSSEAWYKEYMQKNSITNYMLLKRSANASEYFFKVIENPNKVELPFAAGREFLNSVSQNEGVIKDIKDEGGLTILMAKAGLGKTSFCNNLLEQHIKNQAILGSRWVIKIPLGLLQFDGKDKPDIIPFMHIEHEWQLEAFKRALKIEKLVTIILDGFDEIKSKTTLLKINKWVNSLPNTANILLTTREYAYNKFQITSDYKYIHVYKLNQFDKKQRENYVKKFVESVLQDTKLENNTVQIATQLLVEINKKIEKNPEISEIIGIPLESYIFCQLLEPIIEACAKEPQSLIENFNKSINTLDVDNTAKLYQEFIAVKLRIYARKHLGINPNFDIAKEMLFNIMGSANQILELFAFKQAFGLRNSADELKKYQDGINFDINQLELLEDTGLLRVSKDKKTIYFNHQTYQEFYAAMAIIRGCMSELGVISSLVKQQILEKRYDPSYQVIFNMASGFSVVAGAIIPGYNINEHLDTFWKQLTFEGDILGAASKKLFMRCMRSLSNDQRTLLLEKYSHQKGFEDFEEANNDIEKGKNYEQRIDNIEDEAEEVPINEPGKSDDTAHITIDFNKDNVAQCFKRLRKANKINAEIVKELEKHPETFNGRDSYWWLDGGIEAIGCVGKYFTKKLADYLTERTDLWDNNASLAAESIIRIYKDLDSSDKECNQARENCLYAMQKLAIHKKVTSDKQELLMRTGDIDLLGYLLQDFENSFTGEATIVDIIVKFEEILNKFWKILILISKLDYALIFDSQQSQIIIQKNSKLIIDLNENPLLKLFITSVFFDFSREQFKSFINRESLSLSFIEFITIKYHNKTELLRSLLSPIEKDEYFDKVFKLAKVLFEENLELWKDFYSLLKTADLISKNSAQKFSSICDGTRNGDWGHYAYLIKIVGYMGIYFNQQHAEYLKKRASYYVNNKVEAVNALNSIHASLTKDSIDKTDENYKNAVNAYKSCKKDIKFKDIPAIEEQATITEETQMIEDNKFADNSLETPMQLDHDSPQIEDSLSELSLSEFSRQLSDVRAEDSSVLVSGEISE